MVKIFLILLTLLILVGIFSARNTFTRYVAVSFDMFVNVLTLGMLDMTISTRAGIAAAQGKIWGKLLSKFLNIFETDHCQKALHADLTRAENLIKVLTPYASSKNSQ
jgi:hypothetical protein